MVPIKKKKEKMISQEAFDEVVKENMDDFGMEAAEALQDAIQSFTLQGVDLSGIVTVENNPVIKTLQDLKTQFEEHHCQQFDHLSPLLLNLANLCDPNSNSNSNSNAAIASRNGGVELLTSIAAAVASNHDLIILSLRTLLFLLHDDVHSSDSFHKCGGPDIIIRILDHYHLHPNSHFDVINACFSIIAASSTSNEILKQSFINLQVDHLFLTLFNSHYLSNLPALYHAIRILLTPDDFRVAASQVYGYARQFAKAGIADALVDSLHQGLTSPTLVSAAAALKAVAVNDEICRSIADKGGIDVVLQCIDNSGEQLIKSVARSCCSLLAKLAGSDLNKSAIIEKGGLDRLIMLAARFANEPSVIQEVMYVISVLSLRSPNNASRAMEAGAGDLAIEAMQKFPDTQQLQRSACIMIRNLVARNPENRKILLDNGIEKIIRKSKVSHENCKAAATDALRDLGLDNYNL